MGQKPVAPHLKSQPRVSPLCFPSAANGTTKPFVSSLIPLSFSLQKHFSEFPSARLSFSEGFRGQWMGSSVDIVLLSDDLDAALDTAEEIRDVIAQNKKISEPSVSMDKGLPQVEIVIDRERAYNMGVDIATVAREINYAINGSTACTYKSNGKDYSVVVAYRPEDRKTINDLESIFVRGTGGMVSVANFASTKKGLGPVSIRRENQKRIIHVRASNLTEENDNVIEEEIRKAIQSSVIIPESVVVNYEGAWKDTMDQYSFYAKIAIMAILLVFGVMASTYESFKAPLINLATMPFILIGVILIGLAIFVVFSLVDWVRELLFRKLKVKSRLANFEENLYLKFNNYLNSNS